MPFPNPRRQRNVVLEVNCPEPIDLYILQDKNDVANNPEVLRDLDASRVGRRFLPGDDPGIWKDDEGLFLCHCRGGRDTIDFAVDGPFSLVVVGGPVFIYSQDSQQIEMHVLEPEVFTRIANRRQRNPQFEMMMYQQRMNMERRFQELADETERRIVAAQAGAKHKYAQERIKLGLDGRPLPDLHEGRKASLKDGARSTVRDEGSDRGESEDSERLADEPDVSAPAKQPRRKTEKAS